MIHITRSEKIVSLQVDLSIGWNIKLKYERNSEMDAILIKNQLQKDLDEKIASIRREAYNQGWKDKQGKKVHKKKNFFTGMDTTGVGY